jgi:molybdopterin converting factor subunit 1
MKVRVLYFASVRDLTARADEFFELMDGASVDSFQHALFEKYPALAARASALRFARNEAFAELSDLLSEGDTLAVIPPVAGG